MLEIAADGSVSVRDGGGAAVWQAQLPDSGESAEAESASDASELAVPAHMITATNAIQVPQRYAGAVELAARASNISPVLLSALVWQESRWNAQAVSSKGAVGLTQLMPGTARDLGVDSRDPLANLIGGARYLRQQLDAFDGNVEKALAAYNAGPGRVRRTNGIPAIRETQLYVKSIVDRVSAITSGANL